MDAETTTPSQLDQPSGDKPEGKTLRPLRVWPVVILLLGMVAARWTIVIVGDGPENLWMIPAFAPMLCSFAILLWWLTFSRASWKERLGGLVALVALVVGVALTLHPTMQGPAMTVVTLPMGYAGFGLTLIVLSRRLDVSRTWIALLVAAVGFGFSGLLRSDGIRGDFAIGLDWRWNASGEERFLAAQSENAGKLQAIQQLEADLDSPAWPGFRGADRTSVQRGSLILPDWERQPPEELWRVPVGPGWSSFAVAGDLLFTQEQRGGAETVVCYDGNSGQAVWSQSLEGERLEDLLGGPGPRATPTIYNGVLYTTGATGWVMRLDAKTGEVTWKADLKELAGRKPPEWGFCASPLGVGDRVIVYGGGSEARGLFALDAETGDVVWSAAAGDHSYGSAQRLRFDDREVIGFVDNRGASLYDPSDGTMLLQHEWKVDGYRCLQPVAASGNRLLIPTGIGFGTRCLEIDSRGGNWTAAELWTSRDLKPDYSDCVLFEEHLYGFDGAIFACIAMDSGKRRWKGGRYGKGQVLLLEDSRMLLVLSETGDVVLLAADPDEHKELARIKAIDGKTWNHPVLVGDRLYVRNSEEAACFRLPLVVP